MNRLAIWAIVIWTGFMALGIYAAFLGIGGDCVSLSGSALTECQADAFARGSVGLGLLVILWLLVVVPLAVVWRASRPRSTAGGEAH